MRNKIVYDKWTFGDSAIQSGNIYLAMSLMSDALEANSFTATVKCSDRSIIDFERNAPLTYYYQERQRGIFYVQSITRNGPTSYTISATSAIGLLIDGLHYGGLYTGQTVAEILPSICGTVPYVIKTNLRDIALYGWLPVASPRDNLSQVLFAIGAFIRTDLDGVLHIESLWDGIIGSTGRDKLHRGARVDYTAKVTQVVVTEHQYVEGNEETTLFEGAASEGDVITFDDPMHSLTASGFSILEQGANYAKVSAGSGTLTGKRYIHNTREITRDVSQANEPNIKTVTEATLVSIVNAVSVAERLVNYFQWTETILADVSYTGELPGDRTDIWHPYDEVTVPACIANAEIMLSHTLKASETLLVGFVPPQHEQVVLYDQRVVLTGTGTFSFPAGVTDARAVLISGGQAGGDGEDGSAYASQSDTNYEDGGRSFYGSLTAGSRYNLRANASASGGSAPAGTGGAGGLGGQPGKVLQIDLTVTDGAVFAYSCGVGGTESLQEGTDTVFGDFTSADGDVPDTPYIDVITGESFARRGVAGEDGGNGGNTGERGEDLTLSTGGYGISGENDSDSGNYGDSTAFEGFLSITAKTSSWNASVSGAGGGGPGGQANGVAGENGQNAAYRDGPFDITLDESNANLTVFPPVGGKGGNGANAPAQDDTAYGSGGHGGGGGGGGGAIGSSRGSSSCSKSVEVLKSGTITGSVPRVSCYASARVLTARSSFGLGGKCSPGVNGCIILYFGVPHKIVSGPVRVKEDRVMLDKTGRLIIV